jgi:hypothetical protein
MRALDPCARARPGASATTLADGAPTCSVPHARASRRLANEAARAADLEKQELMQAR